MAQANGHEGPLHDLTGFQRDLLITVARLGDPSGLDIKTELETDYEAELNHGRLYPNLDELVDMGLLDKGEKDRRTNEYRLTARGRREMEADQKWRADAMEGGA